MHDTAQSGDQIVISLDAAAPVSEATEAIGHYDMKLTDNMGQVLWSDVVTNLITNGGKALLLDSGLAASGASPTNYLGLIAGASAPTIAAADTMGTHAGWTENTASAQAGNRQAASFSAASGTGTVSKPMASSLAYVFTNGGTIQGAFLVGGTGAVATAGSTAGTLVSAGTLATAQPVITGNTLTVSYTAQLT